MRQTFLQQASQETSAFLRSQVFMILLECTTGLCPESD